MFRRQKHEFVKAECDDIEMQGSRNDAQKIFQKFKRISEGFKSEASFCKNQYGNMVTDIKSSLDLDGRISMPYLTAMIRTIPPMK